MGTICAPFANIFMWKFEKLRLYSYIRDFNVYCRFIEDIFFLRNETESELIEFIANLNKSNLIKNSNSHIPKPVSLS